VFTRLIAEHSSTSQAVELTDVYRPLRSLSCSSHRQLPGVAGPRAEGNDVQWEIPSIKKGGNQGLLGAKILQRR